jgi:hypothetical protein
MANWFKEFVHPFLYLFSPGLSVLTSSIVDGDPGALVEYGNQHKDVAVHVTNVGKQVAEHAKWLTDTWDSPAGKETREVLSKVAQGLEEHGGEIGKYAGAAEKLGTDFKRLIDLVENGQSIAEGVVKALASIPFVGQALATSYAATTYAWTGMCAVQLVHTGMDVAEFVNTIDDSHVQKSYTPPAAGPIALPAATAAAQG